MAFRRHGPEPGVVFLTQRRVYILPTRHGLSFGLALILMLIGSINYNLSLGYVLTFLLAGLGVVSILHTFRNLVHLYVSAGRVSPIFAGEIAHFQIVLENKSGFIRHSLDLACGGPRVRVDVPAAAIASWSSRQSPRSAAGFQLQRVTMDTRFPLGLMRAWSYVQPDMRALVYPRPDTAALPVPDSDSENGDVVSTGAGTTTSPACGPIRLAIRRGISLESIGAQRSPAHEAVRRTRLFGALVRLGSAAADHAGRGAPVAPRALW